MAAGPRRERATRWWRYFREGHGNYLAYSISFISYLALTYALLVERFDWLKAVFPHLWMYALVFLIIYPPLSLLVGRWHIKKQWYVEQAMTLEQGMVSAKLSRIKLQMIEGTATPDDVDWAISYYKKIEAR